MSNILAKITNNFLTTFKHPVNYYVIPNRKIYGDFLRSVETTYYTFGKVTKDYTKEIRPDCSLYVYHAVDEKELGIYDPDYDEDYRFVDLLKWYLNKEDILDVCEELMNIYESMVGIYYSDNFVKEIPALVYDESQKDWIISETETEPVFVTNVLSVRETGNWDNLISISSEELSDIPFRIVQALHYFNNLVRAEKVPDWVYKIISDYEVYRLLDA